jgi:hypothetical protein
MFPRTLGAKQVFCFLFEIFISTILQVCSDMAINAELDLMRAELHDNLVSVRKYRRAYCVLAQHYLGAYKPGSGMGTRKRSEMTQAGERIEAARLRYQHAWHAADLLSPGGSWSLRYKWLDKKDIRGPNPGDDMTDLAAVRKPRARDQHVGRYEQSWIWTSVQANDEPDESVRVQWAKMSATAARWEEEVVLVVEEMRRTLASFEAEATDWDSRVGRRAESAPAFLTHALDAYASRQARLWRCRILVFAQKWLPLLQKHTLGSTWSAPYAAMVQADIIAREAGKHAPPPPLKTTLPIHSALVNNDFSGTSSFPGSLTTIAISDNSCPFPTTRESLHPPWAIASASSNPLDMSYPASSYLARGPMSFVIPPSSYQHGLTQSTGPLPSNALTTPQYEVSITLCMLFPY